MGKRFRRAVLALSLLALLGIPSQPAAAREHAKFTFTGHIAVGPGVGYFCVPPEPFTNKCPPSDLDAITTADSTDFNNSAEVAFASNSCVVIKATENKNKHPLGAGTCSFAGTGEFHGYCGWGEGHAEGTIHLSSTSIIPPGGHVSQSYSFFLSFTNVSDLVVYKGMTQDHTTGQVSHLNGVMQVAPPTPGCFDKQSVQSFLMVGQGTITPISM